MFQHAWLRLSNTLYRVDSLLFRIHRRFYSVAPLSSTFGISSAVLHLVTFLLFICYCVIDCTWILTQFLLRILLGFYLRRSGFFRTLLLRYLSSLVNTWRRRRFYPVTSSSGLSCFFTDTDSDVLQRCFEAERAYKSQNVVSFFSSNSEYVYVDNCANTHISNQRQNFISFTPSRRGSRYKVSTVGGAASPEGEGTVRWSWKDDKGQSHTFNLPNCKYYPDSPACILSPSQLGLSLRDYDRGTGIDSGIYSSTFYWKGRSSTRTIHHTPAFMPRLKINDTVRNFATYLSNFSAYFDDFASFSLLTQRECDTIFSDAASRQAILGRRISFRK